MGKKSSNRKQFDQKRSHGKEKRQEVEGIREELLNFATTKWGRLWVESILKIGRPYRMRRGINYAMEDRIENLTISKGMIFATVQGTAPMPYRVKVSFDPIPEEAWRKINDDIASKAKYIISLLSNQVPDNLIEIFDHHKCPLFPPATRELDASCSCPDKAVPCKHIAATVLYIARVIDYDPFLLLRLRGREKEEILEELQTIRSCSNKPVVKATKQIRERLNEVEENLEVPSIHVEDLNDTNFIEGETYQIGFNFDKPTGSIDTLDYLGRLPNLENPDIFEQVLRELYQTTMQTMYNSVQHVEKRKSTKKKKGSKSK